jgi:hypothetical protein
MSDSADLSRVIALSTKGRELSLKAHDARAAEKFGRAAEEAEKALPVPDCLVMCWLREEQLDSLQRHAIASAATPADANDALREAFLRLLPSVMAVLDRRKAAGTLLPGSCRPVEEAYAMARRQHDMEIQGIQQADAARTASVFAPYVGVETYLCVAGSVAFMLRETRECRSAFVLSDEQKDAGFLFLARAAKLMVRPRVYEKGFWLQNEPETVRQLRELISEVSDMDNPLTKKLCAAWQRVLRSGVLRVRGIDDAIDHMLQLDAQTRVAAVDDFAAGRLQECALAGCAAREAHVSHFNRCSACRTVSYCSKKHQVEDWPSHKAACKAARKAKAEPAGVS